ncbi:MAG: type II toxin-antitoxin system RelE/ParE family toxin [Termitinemataceae bacterium]|nr:MAG: type II toxin-antitoxin system RelE/ParE family toxin [Termitinemataceae bacterium]
MWEVEYTDEFEQWWLTLAEKEQGSVDSGVRLLQDFGTNLPFPYSSEVKNSKHKRMRELRIQSGGHPLRTFYAFDARRVALLLIGGDKTGNDRFYEEFIPVADKIYDQYLREMEE